jgi:hypothetical protein
MELNREELLVGAGYGFACVGFIGWWAVLTMVLCAWLWAFGGAGGTSLLWRRIGVPLVMGLAIGLIRWTWLPALSFFPVWGVLSRGYGIPSADPLPYGDDGSSVGRFWTKVITGSYNPPAIEDMLLINICTRGSLTLTAGLCFVPLAWLSLWAWILMVLVMTVVNIIAVWR